MIDPLDASPWCRVLQSSAGGECIRFDGVSDIAISDVRIRGYSTQIKLVNCSRVLIDRVWLADVIGKASGFGYGIILSGCEDVTIRDVFSEQTSEAGRHHVYLSGPCKRVIVERCHLNGGSQAQIAVYCTAAQGVAEDIRIENNILNGMDSDVGATGAIVVTESVSNLWAHRNTIIDPRPIGIFVQAGPTGTRLTENQIRGSAVAAIGTDQATGWEAIYLRDNLEE